MAKRDIILAKILEGGATRETLMDAAEVNEKGLASQMTYLRLMGQCPMKQEDGTYKIVTKEEWDEHRASSGSGPVKTLSPAERLEKATKRVGRAATALDNAMKRFEAHGSKLNELNMEKAKLELQISEILEGEAQTAVDNAPADEQPETPVEYTVETEASEDENIENAGGEDEWDDSLI